MIINKAVTFGNRMRSSLSHYGDEGERA